MSETLGLNCKLIKVSPNPSYCPHQIIHLCHSAIEMMSPFATATRTLTRTLRYIPRSRETYSKELITSPEILSEPPPTQDDSTNTVIKNKWP